MKFEIPVDCSSCGCKFLTAGYAEQKFPPATCPECGVTINIVDPLSVSVGAERLLYRSQNELQGKDFSVSIICSAIAVESFLTAAFIKWKGIENFGAVGRFPSEAETDAWEKEFPRNGGFDKKPADFVSNFLAGVDFDSFVATDPIATEVMKGFLDSVGESPKRYFQKTLFARRNRVIHWGNLSYERADAELCFKAAQAILTIFRTMDKKKADAADRAWRESVGALPADL